MQIPSLYDIEAQTIYTRFEFTRESATKKKEKSVLLPGQKGVSSAYNKSYITDLQQKLQKKKIIIALHQPTTYTRNAWPRVPTLRVRAYTGVAIYFATRKEIFAPRT